MKMFFGNYNIRDSHALTDQLATRFAAAAGPYQDKLEKLIQEKDYAELARFGVDYSLFSDPASVHATRQCLALYQKCDDYDLGIDRELVALEKFVDSELACKAANRRFTDSRKTGFKSPLVASVFHTAARIVSSVLGELPQLADLQLEYGPGASSNVTKNTSARWKLSAKPACSANMVGILHQVLTELPHYCNLHSMKPEPRSAIEALLWDCGMKAQKEESFWTVDVAVERGKLMFVPKDAKTDRAIIVEPSLNSLAQKAYGSELKRRLKRAGVNLYDQDLNRVRARSGSINGGLMTVDLSSASDTICKELVAELLPLDWYLALNELRTSNVVYRRSVLGENLEIDFHLEKFSSMGNGFTFELESLIFYALTKAVCHCVAVEADVTVYGDDIICPPAAWDGLLEVFTFCGFSINSSKSFRTGDFRESCGADYYKGVNVRPYYNKTRWSAATLVSFHNQLVRSGWSEQYPGLLEQLTRNIPDHLCLYGPDGYGDGHLIGAWQPRPLKRDRGWGGFVFDTYIQRPLRVLKSKILPGDAILPLYVTYIDASKEESYDPYVVRGAGKEKRISIYTLCSF